ncbi:Lipase, class 3, partial [Cynara cardunculus var. scolymus]
MMEGSVGDRSGINESVIIKACFLAVKSHKSAVGYIKETGTDETVIFAFSGSWSVQDFYTSKPFGETKIDVSLFPSIKSIGNNELAMIYHGFFCRFQSVLQNPSFQNEKYTRSGNRPPCKCVTFGSPLVGDRIFTHALNRENWARFFLHFVGRHDIVPRITLAPFSSIRNEFHHILDFLNPNSRNFQKSSSLTSQDASAFFNKVLKNASSVASHDACNLMGSTNSLLEIISSFVELSPYRPSGTYIFCTGNGKMVHISNPNSVLQILFYSCQPDDESQVINTAKRSLCMDYINELNDSLLGMQDVVYLDDKMEIPLSSNGYDAASINTALTDLGLQKLENERMIDSNIPIIEKTQDLIAKYKQTCEDRRIGYYDAFKMQKDSEDFRENVRRLELAGKWDEIVEMLKRYELPDGFESRKDWIELGTKFRKLVEPLDIANYYRHSKDEDTGTYLRDGGRPKRYKFTQRWREHALRLKEGSSSETTFWAKVEQIRRKPFEETKEQIVALEKEVHEWVQKNELEKDVFLEKSTFAEWWKTLPERHRSESCLKGFNQKYLYNIQARLLDSSKNYQ